MTAKRLEESVHQAIVESGVNVLPVNDLTEDDLALIGWSGNPGHIRSVAALLKRVPSAEVEYLAVRAPNGEPIAKGCIDYSLHGGAGTLQQIATRDDLQGLGLATRLIAVAEERIRARGLRWAVIGVEEENDRARRLYERLGYEAYSREHDSWDREDDLGNVSTYETEIVLLRKRM